MKSISLIFLCLLFVLTSNAQLTYREKSVKKITLAKEDSEGNIVENIDFLNPKDIPLYCYIDLDSDEPTLVAMKIIAVKAKKIRPNGKVVEVRYKTKKGDTGVEFNAKPGSVWAIGKYRVDVYLDGKLSKSKNFNVEPDKKMIENKGVCL